MTGLGLFLYGAMRAICGIGQAVENHQKKQTTYTLPNGKQYYYDRTSKTRLMDGTLIIYQGDRWIDDKYNVVCDIYAEQESREKREKKDNSKLTYFAFSKLCNRMVVFEAATDRIIAKITRDFDGTCRKWYFYDNTAKLYPNITDPRIRRCMSVGYPNPTDTRKNDNGVVISTEEFERIKKEFQEDKPYDRKSACYFYDCQDKYHY